MNQHQQAREYYFSGSMTQKQIAHSVGVDEKTIYRWIRKESWDKLKLAAQTMPAIISDNFCSQLVEMQNHIAAREEGKRFPTIQEAETMRKLVLCITRMKENPSLGTNLEMMMCFTTYVNAADIELSRKIVSYADTYFKSKARLGSLPYQFTYGAPAPHPTEEELSEINEALGSLKEETPTDSVMLSGSRSTTHSDETPTKGVTEKEETPTESVILSGSQSATQPNESLIESVTLSGSRSATPSNKTPTESVTLSGSQSATPPNKTTEAQSGITAQPASATQAHSEMQEEKEAENPCPPPGTTGHSAGTQTTFRSFGEGRGEVPIPPFGVTWLGANQVYDPQLNRSREIKNGEANWLYKNGFLKR